MIPQMILPIVAILLAAAISALGTWMVRRIARARDFVDRPGGHKGHIKPVALGGGIAVTLAIALPMLGGILLARLLISDCPDWVPESIAVHLGGILTKTPLALGIVAAALAMCLMGVIDDARPLSAGLKLFVQAGIAGGLVIGFDLRVMSDLGFVPSTALSVLWILTLTNSLNFLDNMDGLTTGVAIIVASVFATTAMISGQVFVPVCCWLLVGALLGFLPYNFNPASIYLGDAGSTVVGLLLAVFTILTTFADPSLDQRRVGIIAPLVVMAVPLYDTASVMFIRWRTGDPIWAGDRRHFSHRLVRRGMTQRRAVLVIWLATLVTALPAIMLPRATWAQAWGILLQTFLVVMLVALLESPAKNDPHGRQI